MRTRWGLLLVITAVLAGLVVFLSLNLKESPKNEGAMGQKPLGAEEIDAQGNLAAEEETEGPGEAVDDTESGETPTDENRDGASAAQSRPRVVVAWQPSHQDDTGDASWHEYLICGDIVDRAMRLCTAVSNVKCWDLSHGLTGTNNYRPQPTNTVAFDVEVSMANQANADYFISIHNDGGAPSGILGLCMPNDPLSRSCAEKFVNALCARTGLPKRGIWEVRLYSLEPERNRCPVRILLEIGDNQKDRALLESEQFRELVAQALAEVVNGLPDLR